jgi:hypothetical protein
MPGPDLTTTPTAIARRVGAFADAAKQDPSDYRSPQDMKDAAPEHAKFAAETTSHLSDKQIHDAATAPKIRTRGGGDYHVAYGARKDGL